MNKWKFDDNTLTIQVQIKVVNTLTTQVQIKVVNTLTTQVQIESS